MPDALSKTVPIWCAVMNKLLFPDVPQYHALYTPSEVVGKSEHSQIEARLDEFVEQAKVRFCGTAVELLLKLLMETQTLQMNLVTLRARIEKPLRPQWITQQSSLELFKAKNNFYPVVCCTASRRVAGAEASEGGYIQGAGDDSEGWSQGLTPPVFWKYRGKLGATPEDDLPNLIQELTAIELSQNTASTAVRISPTNLVFVGTLETMNPPQSEPFDYTVICSERSAENTLSTAEKHVPNNVLHLQCASGKPGSRALRTQLAQVQSSMTAIFSREDPPKILFACSTGRDLSVGVALVVLCRFFDDEGVLHQPHECS